MTAIGAMDFPSSHERRDLFFHGLDNATEFNGFSSVTLLQGAHLSAATFRNSLFLEVWKQLAQLRTLKLRIVFEGKIQLSVHYSSKRKPPAYLAKSVLSAPRKTAHIVELGPWDKLTKNARIFWDIIALSDSVIYDVSFVTEDKPLRDGNMIVALRTFGRSQDIVDLLSSFERQSDSGRYEEFLDRTAFVLLDTSPGAEAFYGRAPTERLNLFAYAGANLGGGGNASIVLSQIKDAAAQAEFPADAILVLDDDLDISLKSLFRYWVLGRYQKTSDIVTLPVLMKSEPKRIWEDGGIWGRYSKDKALPDRTCPFPRLIRHGFLMEGFDHLDELAELNYPEYSTFIFYGMPWETFLKLDFPAAFFLRGDDIEYSLRAGHRGVRILSNPNLLAWHEPAHSYGQEYMAILHGLIINLQYGAEKKEHFLEFFLGRLKAHSAIQDDLGLSVYQWVLETLVEPGKVLGSGFEEHYLKVLAASKQLDRNFSSVDEVSIEHLLRSSKAPKMNIRAPYLHMELPPNQDFGVVILENHTSNMVVIYQSDSIQQQLKFAGVAAKFCAALVKFDADFDSMREEWRERLKATSQQSFWSHESERTAASQRVLLSHKRESRPAATPQSPQPVANLPQSSKPASKGFNLPSRFSLKGGKGKHNGGAQSATSRPGIPADFDADVYLMINKDVKDAGWSAEEHFIQHGRQEGRRWRY